MRRQKYSTEWRPIVVLSRVSLTIILMPGQICVAVWWGREKQQHRIVLRYRLYRLTFPINGMSQQTKSVPLYRCFVFPQRSDGDGCLNSLSFAPSANCSCPVLRVESQLKALSIDFDCLSKVVSTN